MGYISTMGRTAYIRVNGNGDYPLVPFVRRNSTWRDATSSPVIEVREHSRAGCVLRISGVPEFTVVLLEPAAPGTTQ